MRKLLKFENISMFLVAVIHIVALHMVAQALEWTSSGLIAKQYQLLLEVLAIM